MNLEDNVSELEASVLKLFETLIQSKIEFLEIHGEVMKNFMIRPTKKISLKVEEFRSCESEVRIGDVYGIQIRKYPASVYLVDLYIRQCMSKTDLLDVNIIRIENFYQEVDSLSEIMEILVDIFVNRIYHRKNLRLMR